MRVEDLSDKNYSVFLKIPLPTTSPFILKDYFGRKGRQNITAVTIIFNFVLLWSIVIS